MRPLLVAIFTLALLGGQAAHAIRVYVSVPFETSQSIAVVAALRKANMLAEEGNHNNLLANENAFLKEVAAAASTGQSVMLVATPVHRQDSVANFQAILKTANASNQTSIPVFWLSTSIPSIRGIAKFSASNFKAGVMLGEMYCSLQSESKSRHAFLLTPDDACVQRRAGFVDAMERNCPDRVSEVAYEKNIVKLAAGKPYSARLLQDTSKEIMQELFLVDEALDSVFGCHDDFIVGAVQAANSMRADGNVGVLFGGLGNTDQARPFVMAQVMYATVELSAASLGDQVVMVINIYHERGVLPAGKYDIYTESRLVLSDPVSVVKKRIFAQYDKNAVPFLHWTYDPAADYNASQQAAASSATASDAAANGDKGGGKPSSTSMEGARKQTGIGSTTGSFIEMDEHETAGRAGPSGGSGLSWSSSLYSLLSPLSSARAVGGWISDGLGFQGTRSSSSSSSSSGRQGHGQGLETGRARASTGDQKPQTGVQRRVEERLIARAEEKTYGLHGNSLDAGLRGSSASHGPMVYHSTEGSEGSSNSAKGGDTAAGSFFLEMEVKQHARIKQQHHQQASTASSKSKSVGKVGSVGTISVSMKIKLLSLTRVDTINSQFEGVFLWKFNWIDERLFYEAYEIDGALPRSFIIVNKTEVWTPDWCTLDGEFKKVIETTRISPQSKMQYGIVANVKATADYDLKMFPFDRQTLPVVVESLSYASDMYEWVLPKASDMTINLSPSGVWKFRKPFYAFRKGSVTVPASPHPIVYQNIQLYLFVERDTQTYYTSFILPLNIINLVTYAALFLDPSGDDASDIAVTTMLSVVAYLYILYQDVPKTPYTTWMGFFIMFSVLLVFMANIEVGICKAICDNHRVRTTKGASHDYNELDIEEMSDARYSEDVPPKARRIRRVFRALYLVVYIGMNVCLMAWAIYVGARRDYQDEHVQ